MVDEVFRPRFPYEQVAALQRRTALTVAAPAAADQPLERPATLLESLAADSLPRLLVNVALLAGASGVVNQPPPRLRRAPVAEGAEERPIRQRLRLG